MPASREPNAAELQLAGTASAKLKRGEKLTKAEGRAYQKATEFASAAARAKLLRAVPQKDMVAMCGGRQGKQLQDMQRIWGLPFAGDPIDLFEFFGSLWKFLIKHGPAFRLIMEAENCEDSSLLEKLQKARIWKTQEDAKAAALRNAEREGRLRDVGVVSGCLELLVKRVRTAGERARRKWGDAGYEFFVDLVDGFGSDLRGFIDAERLRGDSSGPAAHPVEDVPAASPSDS